MPALSQPVRKPMPIHARLACVILLVVTASVKAEEVTLPHKGLTLNANLELAPGKKLSDGVILITHGALAHRRMEIVTTLQKLFKERGYSTLAINLSLGINNRSGMYDCKVTHRHLNSDAVDEIGAWLEWLKKQGATRVALLGHSRGGAQTAFYLAVQNNPMVNGTILLAPAVGENSNADTYQKRFRKPLVPLLEKAQKLIRDGKGDTILEHVGLMTCNDTSATSSSFISYYGPDPKLDIGAAYRGPDPRLDTPFLISYAPKPILVVVAGKDDVVIDLDKKVAPLVDGKRVRMKVINGANHFFIGFHAEDAADATVEFLKSIGY